MAEKKYIIGIDIGTGSVKAVAMDPEGAVIAGERVHYSFLVQNNEVDADKVFEAFTECLYKLIDIINFPPYAISFSSMMHGIMAVDENGRPLSHLILWSDTRSSEIASALRNSETGKNIYKATGTPLHAMSPLCKLRWFKENDPVLFKNAWKIISIKEYIWYRLSGHFEIDHSVASATGLFNIRNLKWDEEAMQFAGIDAKKLSEPVPTSFMRTLPVPRSVQDPQPPSEAFYIIGASDGCLANLGSFSMDPSVAAITIGTSAAVRITNENILSDSRMMPFSYILNEQNFICGGAVNNGGNLLHWLVENFLALEASDDVYQQVFKEISQSPSGANGLIFLPYIKGERAPVWDEKASGVFLGVRSNHTKNDFARAVVEGLCFALADLLFSLEEMSGPIERINLSGGAASEMVTQILADVTGKEIYRNSQEDSSAIGAGYLALKALGMVDDYESLKKPADRPTLPDPGKFELYRNILKIYRSLYRSLELEMHAIHALIDSDDK